MPSQKLKLPSRVSTNIENPSSFNAENFHTLCDLLGNADHRLKEILEKYGYPPFWSREPGFSTLIHIILEQQVSLASAKAAFEKLRDYTGGIDPATFARLSDAELRACYFSRQKIRYARHLSEAILSNQLDLESLSNEPDAVVKTELIKITGIGNWTTDVYLMMALHRADCFPTGDIALVNSFRKVMDLRGASKEDIALHARVWMPHRTIAAYLLWHDYLSVRKKP